MVAVAMLESDKNLLAMLQPRGFVCLPEEAAVRTKRANGDLR